MVCFAFTTAPQDLHASLLQPGARIQNHPLAWTRRAHESWKRKAYQRCKPKASTEPKNIVEQNVVLVEVQGVQVEDEDVDGNLEETFLYWPYLV